MNAWAPKFLYSCNFAKLMPSRMLIVAVLCCGALAGEACACNGQAPSCSPHCPCRTREGFCQDWDDDKARTCDAALSHAPSKCPVCTAGSPNCFTQQVYLEPGCRGAANVTVQLPADGTCKSYPGAIEGAGPGSTPDNPVWVSKVTCDLSTTTLHGIGGGTSCDGNIVVDGTATVEKYDGTCVHHSIPVGGKPLSFWVRTTGACVPPPGSNPIVVGSFEDTFHQAESAAVVRVLQSRGYNATLRVFGHKAAFDALWSGETDIMPSVWLPYGHAQFIQDVGKKLNVDYVELGTTSEEGVFFWAVSRAGSSTVRSIDDLANPSNTAGFVPEIYGAPLDTGASKAAIAIVRTLNERRKAIDSNAADFVYVPSFEKNVKNLESNATSVTLKFVSALWVPWWGYKAFIFSGNMSRLDSGSIGSPAFGPPNRGTTLTTPKVLGSGKLDSQTLGVLASMFVGNAAVSSMDNLIHFKKMTALEAAALNEAVGPNKYWFEVYKNTTTPVADLTKVCAGQPPSRTSPAVIALAVVCALGVVIVGAVNFTGRRQKAGFRAASSSTLTAEMEVGSNPPASKTNTDNPAYAAD